MLLYQESIEWRNKDPETIPRKTADISPSFTDFTTDGITNKSVVGGEGTRGAYADYMKCFLVLKKQTIKK